MPAVRTALTSPALTYISACTQWMCVSRCEKWSKVTEAGCEQTFCANPECRAAITPGTCGWASSSSSSSADESEKQESEEDESEPMDEEGENGEEAAVTSVALPIDAYERLRRKVRHAGYVLFKGKRTKPYVQRAEPFALANQHALAFHCQRLVFGLLYEQGVHSTLAHRLSGGGYVDHDGMRCIQVSHHGSAR
eukprot:COSAG01_NODE_16000_length_1279_cov_1.905932_1_plen_194_part_00